MPDKLIVENLSASYSYDKNKQHEVFKDVSFEVNKGEILALFGSNGCGKSTLLKVISGIERKTGGKIYSPYKKNNNSLSVLPQDYRASFFNWTSLLGNILLTLPNPIRNKKKHVRKIYEVANELGVEIDLHLKPQNCSGGMLQQAALIRTFVSEPKLIFADEPFSALDISISSQLRRSFLKMVKEKNIIALVVLHNLEDIIEVADKVLAIQKRPYTTSKLDTSYSKATIINNENISRVIQHKEISFIERAQKLLSEQM